MYLTAVQSSIQPMHRSASHPAQALQICDVKACRSRCHLRAWCKSAYPNDLHAGLGIAGEALVFGRRQVHAGQILYREGQKLECLFEVRSGNLKSSLSTANGQERVTGFHMSGDLLGLDGVASGHHVITVTALEDTEVCTMSYARLASLAQGNAELQHSLMRLMGQEIVRELRLVVLLASMNAEERLANFLLGLSGQMAERGYSPSDFHMRMTRADIGSYLGLSLETVSRTFSALQRLDFLDVHQRHIRITDMAGLAGRQ